MTSNLYWVYLYITKCVRPARYFIYRMLAILRQNHNNIHIQVNADFYADINWFNNFLIDFNDVIFYDNYHIYATIDLDASLTGLGGMFDNLVYHLQIKKNLKKYYIAHLELLNVFVALKIWAHCSANRKFCPNCDNLAIVKVLRHGRACNVYMAKIARNIWLILAMFNIHLTVNHIAGSPCSPGGLIHSKI